MHGLFCLKGEIHNVLAQLRVSGRARSSSSFFGDTTSEEMTRNSLVRGFKELHPTLGFYSDLHQVDTCVWLQPFVDVVESELTGVDVMNVALTSMHKFLLYQLIDQDSPRAGEALQMVAGAVMSAKFDRHSRQDTELIYIRVMEVLLEALRCPAGVFLTDNTVCKIIQECFKMRCQHDTSPLLMRYTENVLVQMILMIFARLRNPGSVVHGGYGVPTMERILKFLTQIINPNDPRNTPDIREFGLRLVNVALETTGKFIVRHPALMEVIQDDLCKQLLCNSNSHHFGILSLTLRVIFDLFNTIRENNLRVQLEVFFTSVHLRIAESDSSTFEQKELVLESIAEFCHEPDLIAGLYTNYDCQVGCTHLFEDLCKFLAQQATVMKLDDLNDLNLIAAEAILAILDSIAKKFCSGNEENGSVSSPSVSDDERDIDDDFEIRQAQDRKRKLKLAARHFNEQGKKSFEYLQQLGVLDSPLDPNDIADFLFTNPYLDKRQIGEYLGGGRELSDRVLEKYVMRFQFQNMRIDEALRFFLESFVLRGEAQQIERIIEHFAERYFALRPSHCPILTQDAAFILSYSIIQLNTDAHNSQVKKKMTLDAYKLNVKGLNDNKNFPAEYIESIYKSITTHEIRIRSENPRDVIAAGHVNSLQWQNILSRAKENGHFTTRVFQSNGCDMFNILWEPTLTILNFHLKNAQHPKVLARVSDGIETLAKIAHFYQIRSAFNSLIHTLCTDLLLILSKMAARQDIEDDNPFFEQPQDALSANIRIKFIARLLFGLVDTCGGLITDGWSSILKVILWLLHLNLIPEGAFDMDDFADTDGKPLPSLGDLHAPKEQSSSLTTILSDVLSAWFTPEEEGKVDQDGNVKPTWKEEVRETMTELGLNEVFHGTRFIHVNSLLHLVRTLTALSGPIVPKQYRSEGQPRDSSRSRSIDMDHEYALTNLDPVPVETPVQVPYSEVAKDEDETVVVLPFTFEMRIFCLERLTDVAARNLHRVSEVWTPIRDHFYMSLDTLESIQPDYYFERVLVNLLKLCNQLSDSENPQMRTEIPSLLQRLTRLSDRAMDVFGRRLVAGLKWLLNAEQAETPSFIHERDWQIVLSLLKRFAHVSDGQCVLEAFQLTEFIVQKHVAAPVFGNAAYSDLVNTLSVYTGADDSAPVHATRTIEVILTLHNKIPSLCFEPMRQGHLWIRSLTAIGRFATHENYQIRRFAVNTLHKSLLQSTFVISDSEMWKVCFETILLPLLISIARHENDRLQIPSTQRHSESDDLRLRVSSLVFQVWLHNLPLLSASPEFPEVWFKFLQSIRQFLSVSESEVVSTSVIESLKNVLLVLRSNGTFKSVSARTGTNLWEETWNVLSDVSAELNEVNTSLSIQHKVASD